MKESIAWKYFDSHRPNWLHAERLEPMYPPGLADCFIVDKRPTPSRSCWLELKYCLPDDPAYRNGKIPKLRPSQPVFLRRQREQGVPAGILLRVGLNHWELVIADKSHEWVRLCNTGQPLLSRYCYDVTKDNGMGLDYELLMDDLYLMDHAR